MDVDVSVLKGCYTKIQPLSQILPPANDIAVSTPNIIDDIYVGFVVDKPVQMVALSGEQGMQPLAEVIFLAVRYALRHHEPPPQIWMRPMNVLCRGYRKDYTAAVGIKQSHANPQTELLLSKEFESALLPLGSPAAMAMHRKQAIYNILVDINAALYLSLGNGCFLQLAGLAMDECYAKATKSSGGTTSAKGADASDTTFVAENPQADAPGKVHAPAPAAPLRPSTSDSRAVPVIKGTWEVPRASIRIPGTFKGDSSPSCFLHYCVSIYHSKTFSRHPGFPKSHPLNLLIPKLPPLIDTEKDTGSCYEVRHLSDLKKLAALFRTSHPMVMSGQKGASMGSQPTAISQLSSTGSEASLDVRTRRQYRIGDIPSNAARRLMHHIFVHQPHIVELAAFNDRKPVADPTLCPGAQAAGYAQGLPLCAATELPKGLVDCVELFREVLARHTALNYAQLLLLHCPVATWQAPAAGKDSSPALSGKKRRRQSISRITSSSLGNPLLLSVNIDQVFAFVKAVLFAVVPSPLWGDASTRRCILSNIHRWVSLGHTDTCTMSELVHGISTTSFPFGVGPLHAMWVHVWIAWLFLGFVSPLLRTHFYATYSEATTYRTLYYRKPTWAHLTKHGVDLLIQKLQLRDIPQKAVYREVNAAGRNQLGFGAVRLSVKSTGVRPIMNLSAQRTLPSSLTGGTAVKFKAINSVLARLHKCLISQQRRAPRSTGSAVTSVQGVHASLVKYIEKVRPLLTSDCRLHIVSCDVTSAFDTIQQRLALELAAKLLPDVVSSYVIRQYSTLRSIPQREGKNVKLLRARWHRVAYQADAVPAFAEFSRDFANRCSNLVFVDGVEYSTLQRKSLVQLLQAHLLSHIVQLPNGHYAHQGTGIPQGSILSTLICNLYLGHLEREVLIPRMGTILAQRNQAALEAGPQRVSHAIPGLLMRFTDDFLFLSYNAAVAEAFALAVHGDFKAHNVMINAAKTKSSTPFSQLPLQPTRKITWCGLCFDADTGSVTADYKRLCGVGRIRDSFNLATLSRPMESIARMMKAFLKPKCQPILLDGRVNSVGAVALNIFQLALSTAAKFVCVLNELRARARVNSNSVATVDHLAGTEADDVKKQVEGAVRHVLRLIHNRCKGGVGIPAVPSLEGTSDAEPEDYRAILSLHMGDTDEVRLNIVGGRTFSTFLSLRNPGEPPALQTTVCPLFDTEIKFLVFKAFEIAFMAGRRQFPSLAAWCRKKSRNQTTPETSISIRTEVINSTDMRLSTFFFKLDF